MGGPGRNLPHPLAPPPRQRFPSWKMQRCDARAVACIAPCISPDRLVQPGHKLGSPKRFFDEIERAVLDGAHRHGDVALARDHEDRGRIILTMQLSENVEA